jgi:hypothetical protein
MYLVYALSVPLFIIIYVLMFVTLMLPKRGEEGKAEWASITVNTLRRP